MKCPKKPKREILPKPCEIEHFIYLVVDGDGMGNLNLIKDNDEDMYEYHYPNSLDEHVIQALFNIVKEWHPSSKITLKCECGQDGYNNHFCFDVKRNLTADELEAQKKIVSNRQKSLDEQYDREMKEYLELHHQWKLFKLEEAKRKYVS